VVGSDHGLTSHVRQRDLHVYKREVDAPDLSVGHEPPRCDVYLVMVAPECAPAAKAGGLGDVVFGLSRELELRGHAVEIVLPMYASIHYGEVFGLQVDYHDLWVPWYGGAVHCTVYFGWVHGRKCFFVDPHPSEAFFGREHLYGYEDDVERFTLFSKAALEFMSEAGKRPEVIHCHDWQTEIVPVLLCEQYRHALGDQRVCYTIHNFRYQGLTGPEVLWATQLGRPEHFLSSDRLGDDHHYRAVNLMKGGIVYSNFVTTVSPSHAGEARYGDGAFGLGDALDVHQVKFGGVLNGVDYETWNPEVDPHIPARYSLDSLERKYESKRALRELLWLRDTWSPIVAYVGRLDEQKGMHLVHHALFHTLAHGGQFVLHGTGFDETIGGHFWHLKHFLNEHPDCHLEIGYNEQLAHLIYAGADLLTAPSLFEPCGLAPMIALRYGTVPVVHAVGGMLDTVFDRDHSARPRGERTGYVFHQTDNPAIESALDRALGLWLDHPRDFRELISNGMRADHSWARPGQDYLNIYEHIRHN
jgi:starch synthase